MTEVRSEIDAVVTMYLVEEGQRVEKGDQVIMLECMKINFYVEAPVSGLIHFTHRLGETVSSGSVLAEIA